MLRLLLTILLMAHSYDVYCQDYSERSEVKEFSAQLAGQGEYTVAGLLNFFRQAEYKQTIIDAISRPAERTMEWDQYQDIFLTERRVMAGVKFMLEHHQALVKASKVYGVPPVIITAVIGVETMYGRHRGNYRVLDALTTLAFDYPPRATFFRKELQEFFLLVREEKQMITELKGSYAGAMGYGQFIPSSYRRYAVDFDNDGVRDIWNNPVDAIGSVANYLAEHGWANGQIAIKVNGAGIDGAIYNVALRPSTTIGDLQSLGLDVDAASDAEVSPMMLIGKDGAEYWLGFKNFYVITRYNHSKLYAMAVFQLSEALRQPDSQLIGFSR